MCLDGTDKRGKRSRASPSEAPIFYTITRLLFFFIIIILYLIIIIFSIYYNFIIFY